MHLNLSIENARIPTRKSFCYLREYAAYFYPSAKDPGLVIRQVMLRFAQVLVCIHILFVYYVSRKMLHIQFDCGSGSYQAAEYFVLSYLHVFACFLFCTFLTKKVQR